MKLPWPARVYLALVVLGAGGFLSYWMWAWRGPVATTPADFGLMALLVVLAAVAMHFPLQLTPHYKVDVSIAVVFAFLLLFGAPVALALTGISLLLGGATLTPRRNPATGKRLRTARSVLFNTGQFVVAVGLGGVAYYALLPHQAPAPLGRMENLWAIPLSAAAIYLANSLLVATMVGLQAGRSPLEAWLPGRRLDALQFAGLFLIGLVAALTASQYPWAPLLLALPTAIVYLSLKRTLQLLRQTQEAVEALADMVDRRDRYTFEHSKRVAEYAERIARRMGLPGEEVEAIRLAARVHDLGKIGVPDRVLLKPGTLSPDEWALLRRHPEIGGEILSRFPEYRRGQALVLAHHERFDGGGYPRGLRGDAIPLGAQVIAVADALDAMTSDRPYRQALTLEQALAEFRCGKGAQWSPVVVEALEQVLVAQDRRLHGGPRAILPA